MDGGVKHDNHPKLKSSSPSPISSTHKFDLPTPTKCESNHGPACSSSNTHYKSETSCGKLESGDGRKEQSSSGYLPNLILEQVPSQSEVEVAVTALQNFIKVASSSGALQRILGCYASNILLSRGYERTYNAFMWLLTDPSVKMMVVSLSSDRAFWLSVMNKVLPQKLLELPYAAERRSLQISCEEPDLGSHIWSWILDIIKYKVIELMDNFQSLMSDLLAHPKREKGTSEDYTEREEKVRSSVLLSVVVILIVILARVNGF